MSKTEPEKSLLRVLKAIAIVMTVVAIVGVFLR